MKILFTTSELTPIIKVGGLADVAASLTKALKKMGLDVRICLPKYSQIQTKNLKLHLIAKDIKVNKENVNLYLAKLRDFGVPLYLIENKNYFEDARDSEIYLDTFNFKGIQRFLFFSQAALKIFPYLNWKADVIHCNDWETAFIPVFLKLKEEKIKTILTLHNLSAQGKWNSKDIFDFLNLKGKELETLEIRDKDDDFNLLQQGIFNANFLTTVSPTYKKEILTKEYGEGLEKDLRKNKKKLFGILNGIDTEILNPETDIYLKTNYSLNNLERKTENKIELQEILNLPKDQKNPLMGFIGRLVPQKGIDLFEKIIPDLVKMNSQIIFLGVGEKKFEEMILNFAKKYPKNVSANIKFDSVLAQKIYGGCDIILIPSFFEPCGLIQMIAQRYGTIPIARKTGGLADTIEDGKTGFLFKQYNAEKFLKAIKRCLKLFQDKKSWQKLVKRAMSKDFSWEKSAKEYLRLYQK